MPHKSRICQKTNCNKGKQIAKKWEKHAQIISQCLGAKSQSKAEFESLHSHPHQHQHSSVTHIVTWRCSGKCQLFASGPGDLGPRTKDPEPRIQDLGCRGMCRGVEHSTNCMSTAPAQTSAHCGPTGLSPGAPTVQLDPGLGLTK